MLTNNITKPLLDNISIAMFTWGKFFPRSVGSCWTQARAASYIFSSEHTEIVSLDIRLATSFDSNSMNSSLDKTSVKWLSMYWWDKLYKSWQPCRSAKDYNKQKINPTYFKRNYNSQKFTFIKNFITKKRFEEINGAYLNPESICWM